MAALEILAGTYALPWLGFLMVMGYFLVVTLLLRLPRKHRVAVPRYTPPEGISPAAAAWMLERGKLPRAMAAAMVNMAAKGFLRIEQYGDTYTLHKLETAAAHLEPEEDALACSCFPRKNVEFSFDDTNDYLLDAITEFQAALQSVLEPQYYSENLILSAPAWAVSILSIFSALYLGGVFALIESFASAFFLGLGILMVLGCFAVAVRNLPGTLKKLGTHMPGRTVPPRPWTGHDWAPPILLLVACAGLVALARIATPMAATVIGALFIVNAIFYHALRGPTPAGKELLNQLADFKKFLAEVDADSISRANSPDRSPNQIQTNAAYALALGLDRGWGEQFVGAIANVVESLVVFTAPSDLADDPKAPRVELNLK